MPPELTSVALPFEFSLRELAFELRVHIDMQVGFDHKLEEFIARQPQPSISLTMVLADCRKATERLAALHRFVAHLADHEGAVLAFLQSLPPPQDKQRLRRSVR
jgi:hypothetical protein